MNKKIIVYGLGHDYEKYKETLNDTYEIEAYVDSKKAGEKGIISVEMLKNWEYAIPIFVMSNKYYDEIRDELKKIGVSDSLIINGVDYCKKVERQSIVVKNPVALGIQNMQATPLSRVFGYDRGTPIDRIYIDKFLEKYCHVIHGECIEISENTYTLKYGKDRVDKAYILHYTGENGAIKGDLVTGEGIMSECYDCAVITQTMMFLKDPFKASENIYKMLRHGGCALVTVTGISPISMFDYERWGHYFSFYEHGIKSLFSNCFGEENIIVEQYGNIKTALGFLYGMCAEDFEEDDFIINDNMYPILYGIVLNKK